MKTTAEKIAVMQAFINKNEIEQKALDGPEKIQVWVNTKAPSWNWDFFDYRVAPPKPRKFNRWFLVHSSGALTSNYATEEEAKNINSHLIPRREVVCFEMTEIVNAN
jgi:hypothetical protein